MIRSNISTNEGVNLSITENFNVMTGGVVIMATMIDEPNLSKFEVKLTGEELGEFIMVLENFQRL